MTDKPIFSIRIEDQNSRHTTVTLFNRGANCGPRQTILTEDVGLLERLLEGGEWRWTRPKVEYEVENDRD